MTNKDPQIKDRREGKFVRVCACESRPVAGADLTSSPMVRPQGKVAGPVAHAGTGGTLIATGLNNSGAELAMVLREPRPRVYGLVNFVFGYELGPQA